MDGPTKVVIEQQPWTTFMERANASLGLTLAVVFLGIIVAFIIFDAFTAETRRFRAAREARGE